jgi:hypothetical protein
MARRTHGGRPPSRYAGWGSEIDRRAKERSAARRLLFCEPVFAGPLARWCLRRMGPAGPCYGGGVDTPSLCGRVTAEGGGWDIEMPVTPDAMQADYVCPHCAEVAAKTLPGAEDSDGNL